jgi:predicted MFS family arabinose efflux permease
LNGKIYLFGLFANLHTKIPAARPAVKKEINVSLNQTVSKATGSGGPLPLPEKQIWVALFILFTVNIFNFMDRMLFSVLMQPIKEDLLLKDWQLGIISGLAFAFFYATMGVPLARLSDRSSRKGVISFCLAGWSLMTALTGAAANFFYLLLVRMGVGVGEAGCTPASHSLIADYFDARRRSFAMAIFSAGAPIGIFAGLYGGGALADEFGWRWAFVIMGLPGIVWAVVVYVLMKEPPRGVFSLPSELSPGASLIDTFRHIWRIPAYPHLIFAIALGLFIVYGVTQWMPTFFVRVHDLPLAEVGAKFGLAFGGGSAIGLVIGGKVADWLIKDDQRWGAWFPALVYPLSLPFLLAAVLVSDADAAFLCVFAGAIFTAMPQGPSLATIQAIAPSNARAIASAISLFVASIVGVGLAPFLIGVASDLLTPHYGVDGLRYSIAGSLVVVFWGSWHFYVAGTRVPRR